MKRPSNSWKLPSKAWFALIWPLFPMSSGEAEVARQQCERVLAKAVQAAQRLGPCPGGTQLSPGVGRLFP